MIIDCLGILLSALLVLAIVILLSGSIIVFGAILRTRRQRAVTEREFPLHDAPAVTIQIPTRNELPALTCAERCLAFDYPPDKFEILIGDDSDDAAISARISEFAAVEPKITVVRRRDLAGFKSGNLANLDRYTKTKYVVIFDSDDLPGADFLQRIMAPFVHDPGLAGVQARSEILNRGQNPITLFGAHVVATTFHLLVPLKVKMTGSATFCGSAMALNVDVLRSLEGWAYGAITEDIDYSYRVDQADGRVVYLSGLTCPCETPFTLSDLVRQQMRWGYGNVRAAVDHFPSLFRGSHSLNSRLAGNILIPLTLLLPVFALLVFVSVLVGAALAGIFSHFELPIPIALGVLAVASALLSQVVQFLSAIVASARAGFSHKELFGLAVAWFLVGPILLGAISIATVQAVLKRPMVWSLSRKVGHYQG